MTDTLGQALQKISTMCTGGTEWIMNSYTQKSSYLPLRNSLVVEVHLSNQAALSAKGKAGITKNGNRRKKLTVLDRQSHVNSLTLKVVASLRITAFLLTFVIFAGGNHTILLLAGIVANLINLTIKFRWACTGGLHCANSQMVYQGGLVI